MEPQLTDEEKIALDKKICQLKTIKMHHEEIKRLKEKDEEITSDLEDLKEGQEKLRTFVENGFRNGSDKMREHTKQIQALDNKVDRMIEKFEFSLSKVASDIISEVKAKEMAELRAELRKKNEKEEKKESHKWDLTKILIAVAAGSITTYIVSFTSGGKIS
jgi:hypothetical protein